MYLRTRYIAVQCVRYTCESVVHRALKMIADFFVHVTMYHLQLIIVRERVCGHSRYERNTMDLVNS